MPTVQDEGVCIRHWDWSESSQTVSIFGRGLGVIRAVAKGARRERAPFSGGLDVPTRGEFGAIPRPGEGMATLVSWDLVEPFPALRTSLLAFHSAMYLVDLVHHAVRDHDPHPRLYDALVEALRALGDARRDGATTLWFQCAVLSEAGYAPRLELPAPGAKVVGFSARDGGVVPDPGRAGNARVWRARAETIDAIRAAAGSPGPVGVEFGGAPDVVGRANRLLVAYFADVVGTFPNAAGALFPDARPRGARGL